MDTSDIVEDELLGESEDDYITSYQIPKDKKTNSEQNQSAFRNNSENETTRRNQNPRKRRHGQRGQPRKKPGQFPQQRQPGQPGGPGQPAENKIFHAEAAIKSLKRHIDNGTCPESLQYRARARIRADNDFKTEIKRIRKNAEQEVVKALTRFHYREIDRARIELKQSKRPKVEKTSTRNENCKNRSARSTPAANTDVTITNVRDMAANIQASIAQFSKMMEKLGDSENKQAEKYKCIFSDSHYNNRANDNAKNSLRNKKRKERKKIKRKNQLNIQIEANKKHIKNLSNKKLSNDQINLLAKGLKFIPTPVTKHPQVKRQILRDFDKFARRMRLMYIFHGQDSEPHPFHVKSTWEPPIQRSVALESYLEEVKSELADLKLTKPKNNLLPTERMALKALKRDNEINIKKADKGTTIVVMNAQDKKQEGQIQLNNINHYRPLETPMVAETKHKVQQLINDLYHGTHIDEITKTWLCQTPNPPRIPEFYTLTKIHKPTAVGRPIISGCDGPTEKLSSFVDKLLQPIAIQQKSYLKDSTDFINFIEKTKVPTDVILVSMDVTSLYTNIPQEEGIQTVCRAYETFYVNKPPIPTPLLEQALRLILQENSFQFNGKNYLQIHGTAMGTKMAVAFANIFMSKVETEIISQSAFRPLVWKRYIDDIFSLWIINREEILQFIEQANSHHPTIKFTAEVSETEATFLDTTIHKGERFLKYSILDVRTHFKPTETFQYTHFTSSHPPGVKKGFIKGEALRLLRTNSSKKIFEEKIETFKSNLLERGYPEKLIQTTLLEVKFEGRKLALQPKHKENKRILPFVTTYQPSVPNQKQILMKNWHLIEQQPLLSEIYRDPPLISYKRGRSLKDILVRAKL